VNKNNQKITTFFFIPLFIQIIVFIHDILPTLKCGVSWSPKISGMDFSSSIKPFEDTKLYDFLKYLWIQRDIHKHLEWLQYFIKFFCVPKWLLTIIIYNYKSSRVAKYPCPPQPFLRGSSSGLEATFTNIKSSIYIRMTLNIIFTTTFVVANKCFFILGKRIFLWINWTHIPRNNKQIYYQPMETL